MKKIILIILLFSNAIHAKDSSHDIRLYAQKLLEDNGYETLDLKITENIFHKTSNVLAISDEWLQTANNKRAAWRFYSISFTSDNIKYDCTFNITNHPSFKENSRLVAIEGCFHGILSRERKYLFSQRMVDISEIKNKRLASTNENDTALMNREKVTSKEVNILRNSEESNSSNSAHALSK